MVIHNWHEGERIRRAHSALLDALSPVDEGRASRIWRESLLRGADFNGATLVSARAEMLSAFRIGATHPASPADLYHAPLFCQSAHIIGAAHRQLLTPSLDALIRDAAAAHMNAVERNGTLP